MRLVNLEPRWFDVPGIGTDKDGVTFLCPCVKCLADPAHQVRLGVQFANPVQGGAGILMSNADKRRHIHELRTFDVPPGFLWQREGDTFDTLTLTPSVDASKSGHWHGSVSLRRGRMRPTHFASATVVYAKDQAEYLPLPARRTADGTVTTCWALSWRERLAVLIRGRFYLDVLTFNAPLQPLRPHMSEED